jgi:hypothetical protein
MRHDGCWVLLVVFAFAAPLGAEVNENEAAISAALTRGNSSEALALISQAFSALRPDQASEAKTLIQSILAVAPVELSGQIVVTAIEANPQLGNAVLSGISETSQTEQLAILSRVSFVAEQQPQSFGVVSDSLPKMLNAVDASVPVSDRLTSPDYNPSNLLSETGVTMSPTRPELRRDLIRDEEHLADDLAKLLIDEEEHKSKEVIDKEKEKIAELRQEIKEIKHELREDGGH